MLGRKLGRIFFGDDLQDVSSSSKGSFASRGPIRDVRVLKWKLKIRRDLLATCNSLDRRESVITVELADRTRRQNGIAWNRFPQSVATLHIIGYHGFVVEESAVDRKSTSLKYSVEHKNLESQWK